MKGVSIFCALFVIAAVRAQPTDSEVRPRPNPEFFYPDGAAIRSAVAEFNSDVAGKVNFVQKGRGAVVVTGSLRGLTPGLHGFHIHEVGNVSQGCPMVGPHFNPENKPHGERKAAVRHVGDLGNIEADNRGEAEIAFEDDVIQLTGNYGVVEKVVVIHADPDDGGKGGHADSLTTGHAGNKIACAVVKPKFPAGPWPDQNNAATRWTTKSSVLALVSLLITFVLARVA